MIRSAQRGFCFSIAAVLALAALLLAPGLPARGSQWSAAASVRTGPPRDDTARPALQQLLDGIVGAGAPGVVALINDGRRGWREDGAPGWGRDRAFWQDARGVADLRTRRPMRPRDGFRAAGATQPFVATVALQLVAEHRLSLSDTVERWLPGTLAYGDVVTVRQLLNHTSGVPDYALAPLTELLRGNRFRSWRPRELVALVAGQEPDFAAGTSWSPSNTDYVLAALIIERATGRDLGRELERRILRPLQLRDTYFPVHFPFLRWPHARGYSLGFDEQLNPVEGRLFDFTVYDPSLAWGAANLVSDMDDLAHFYRALLGGRLLPPAQLAEMKTTVEVAPGFRYGLGLEVFDFACGPMWGHSGGVPGFANEVFNSEDGTHQFGGMINADASPAAVYDAVVAFDDQAVREAFAGMPCAAGAPSSGPQRAAAGSAPRLLAGERWSRSAGS